MSASTREPPAPGVSMGALLAIGVAAGAALAIGAAFDPHAAAWGWLTAFWIFSSAPIGAIALGLIHATTGGRWGAAFAPTLRLAALASPLLPVAFVVLLLGLRIPYPWAQSDTAAPLDVGRIYLNAGGFAARGLVALIGWAAIGLMAASGRLGLLGAAVALVFHGVAVSLVAIDWELSITPRFTDSAFGVEFATQQIELALALVALLQPRRAIALACGDLGGLLLAAALAVAYLAGMTFIVKWYGDQPTDAAWYLSRAGGRERLLLLGWILLGALAPIVGCAWRRLRNSPDSMRAIGAAAIVGVCLRDLWLAGPAAPALAALAAAAALVAMSAFAAALALWLDRLPGLAAAREVAS